MKRKMGNGTTCTHDWRNLDVLMERALSSDTAQFRYPDKKENHSESTLTLIVSSSSRIKNPLHSTMSTLFLHPQNRHTIHLLTALFQPCFYSIHYNIRRHHIILGSTSTEQRWASYSAYSNDGYVTLLLADEKNSPFRPESRVKGKKAEG